MVNHVLFGFRLGVFSLAAELGNVGQACRILGIHPSTYDRGRGPVLGSGLENAAAARATATADAQRDEPAARTARPGLRPRPRGHRTPRLILPPYERPAGPQRQWV